MHISRSISTALGLLVITPLIAHAASFSDIAGHIHEAAIDQMVTAGVIKGYADGTVRPNANVNRAEMATMISRALGFVPPAATDSCFPDVKKDQWFSAIICAWAQKDSGILTGYSDGFFRPNNNVSRVEALAMIYRAMGLPTPDLTQIDRSVLKQPDVSTSAWYTRFLLAAHVDGILPIPGQEGPYFYPSNPLLRGEAAAYIAGALKVRARPLGSSASSASDSQASASSMATVSSSSSASSVAAEWTKAISLPFTFTGQFIKRGSQSFTFTLSDAKTTLAIQTAITGYYQSNITCRLYLIDADGFSNEYYLGVQDGQTCNIKVTVPKGNYQLQLQPTAENAYYSLDIKQTSSDGNDGFLEAVPLSPNNARTGLLESGDTYDVYSFTLTTTGQGMIDVSSAADPKLQTVLYLPKDFDEYGFKGPEVGVWYTYQPGTYYVVIGHTGQLAQKQTYSVTFKWK